MVIRTLFGAQALGMFRCRIQIAERRVLIEIVAFTGADHFRLGSRLRSGFCGRLRCRVCFFFGGRSSRTFGTFVMALMRFYCGRIAAGFVMSAILMGAQELVAAAVYLHLAHMGAGGSLGGGGIAAGFVMLMAAGLTLHSFRIAAVFIMDMAAGNLVGPLAVAAAAMDMVAVPLHRDIAVFLDGIAIRTMLMGAGRSRTARGIRTRRRVDRVMFTEAVRLCGIGR